MKISIEGSLARATRFTLYRWPINRREEKNATAPRVLEKKL
jgi:hypothetical protein